MKWLISEGNADPDVTDEEGRSLAHYAVKNGNIDMVKYLVSQAGISANAIDKHGQFLLHNAALEGHFEILKWLISEGNADPRVTDQRGRSLAHLAVRHGNSSILKYLIGEKGLSANTKDKQGHSTLHAAAQYGNFEAIRYLLSNDVNSDVFIKDEEGKTASDHCSDNDEHAKLFLMIAEIGRSQSEERGTDGNQERMDKVWNNLKRYMYIHPLHDQNKTGFPGW